MVLRDHSLVPALTAVPSARSPSTSGPHHSLSVHSACSPSPPLPRTTRMASLQPLASSPRPGDLSRKQILPCHILSIKPPKASSVPTACTGHEARHPQSPRPHRSPEPRPRGHPASSPAGVHLWPLLALKGPPYQVPGGLREVSGAHLSQERPESPRGTLHLLVNVTSL